MLKKLGLALVCLVLVAVAMAAAGFRIERGGSGWPRAIVRSHDDVLEADRERQKAIAASTSTQPPQTAPANEPGLEGQDPAHKRIAAEEAASTFAPTSQTATVDRPHAPTAPEWPDFR